jgi:hypothetical protein
MAPLATYGYQTIITDEVNSSNWKGYVDGILNIMMDSIETEWCQSVKVEVIFPEGPCRLTIQDLWFNMILWGMIVNVGRRIHSNNLYFPEDITPNSIKEWIDKNHIDPNRTLLDPVIINNTIDDSIYRLLDIANFQMYLCNTMCNEDFIFLMQKDKEFNDLMHLDLSDVPIEDVPDVGMKYTKKLIEHIKDAKKYLGYDFCIADSFRTGEGINPAQFKEVAVNIGPKPDGHGGIFEYSINKSFMNRGLETLEDIFIDASVGRQAQIINKDNIGTSGHLARIVGLNNVDTKIHPDPHYDCCTKNFIMITIISEKMLSFFRDRWYRMNPGGVERIIKDDDYHLIGMTIYLRSPMTCASHAKGKGICYKCYGNLAYSLRHINPGKNAAESLTSILTQRLLSAKHLLRASVVAMDWEGSFKEWITVDGNTLRLNDCEYIKNQFLEVYKSDIELENDDEYAQAAYSMSEKLEDYDEYAMNSRYSEVYNEYVTRFTIIDGVNEYPITTKEKDKLYITSDLNRAIREYGKGIDGDKIIIPLSELEGVDIFCIKIQNNELSRSLYRISDILNKKDVTTSMDKNQILQEMIQTQMECNISVMAIHYEVLLSNQMRSANDVFMMPNWENPNEDYTILTLDQALMMNPSPIKSFMYQKFSKNLVSPLTFKKHGSSMYDDFVKVHPQNDIDYEKPKSTKKHRPISPIELITNPELVTSEVWLNGDE